MKRTTIVAEESVLYRLHRLADTRGTSFGEIVREALEEKPERERSPLTFLDVPFEPPPGWPSAILLPAMYMCHFPLDPKETCNRRGGSAAVTPTPASARVSPRRPTETLRPGR